MPTFSAALAAFMRALSADPDSFTVLNNIGVVNRELGRLDESAAACRRVGEITPDFVFGHYNLGPTSARISCSRRTRSPRRS